MDPFGGGFPGGFPPRAPAVFPPGPIGPPQDINPAPVNPAPANPAANQAGGGFVAAQQFIEDQMRLNRGLQRELGTVRQQVARIIGRELKSVFAYSRTWELEKTLGNGSYGVTVLLRDRDPLNARHHRRLVLKRSIAMDLGDRDLVNEMIALKVMRGNAHVAQLVASTPDTRDYRNTSSIIGRTVRRIIGLFSIGWFTNPTRNIFRTLSVTGGPALLLEYCENGDLLSFLDRIQASEILMPNRVIWSLILCFVRMAVGLAHPMNSDSGAPEVLEEIRGRPRAIIHGDIAARNIVVGTTDKDVPEHQFTPILKLIDFGMARETNNTREAIQDNLLALWTVMMTIITKRYFVIPQNDPGIYNGIETYATAIIPPYDGHGDPHQNLDPEIRTLMVECMAVNEQQRPSLEDVLRRAQQGAAKPPSAFIRGRLTETDDAVRAFMEQMLLVP
ncbi:kinase-like domain-containing protein [Nemania sp. FL0031]|nr:kinase-like domain-containing protein [Nemania sp. FL0031]